MFIRSDPFLDWCPPHLPGGQVGTVQVRIPTQIPTCTDFACVWQDVLSGALGSPVCP